MIVIFKMVRKNYGLIGDPFSLFRQLSVGSAYEKTLLKYEAL